MFTPTKLPLAESNIYARRDKPERALARAIDRAQVPVLFGEYGVGKTSLVTKFFQGAAEQGKLVHVPTAHNKTFEDVVQMCLEHLDFRVERKAVSSRQGEASAGASFKVLSAKASKGRSVTGEYELVVQSPTDRKLLQVFNEAQLTIIIDEMHRASPQFRDDVLDLIKAANTLNLSYPQLVLVGTAQEATDLVLIDPGVDRILVEVKVPLMETDEAVFIVSKGMASLGINLIDDQALRLVKIAARVPSIVHSISLDAAQSCLDRNADVLSRGDMMLGVHAYVTDHGKRLYAEYMQAVPTTGSKRYRKHVLHAVASVDGEYATMQQITDYVSNALSEKIPSTALSGPLQQLKEELGKPLKGVERHDGKGRLRNLTAFRNPMLKFFVRFIENADAAGVLKKFPAPDSAQGSWVSSSGDDPHGSSNS